MSSNHRMKEQRKVQIVHEPEVMTDGKPQAFSDAGLFPALQTDLRDSLTDSLKECEDCAEQLKKIARAKADLMKRAVRDAQKSYERTRDELGELGV